MPDDVGFATKPALATDMINGALGAKGQRWYSWAIIEIINDSPGHHHLLVRRKDKTGELAHNRC